MNLTVDIGNTVVKMAVIDNSQVVETFRFDTVDVPDVEAVFDNYPLIEAAIMVSSGKKEPKIKDFVRSKVLRFVDFGPGVKVPIQNLYKTPNTLGQDRLVAAVGASMVYPAQNVMIVDFGTAITIDVVSSKGEFLGGNISLGLKSRFRALHEFTFSLPLCTVSGNEQTPAADTLTAIETGVVQGIIYEIEGYIKHYLAKYDDLRIIFTGGDSNFFAKRFKNPIFATYDLVSYGLNRILEYNAD